MEKFSFEVKVKLLLNISQWSKQCLAQRRECVCEGMNLMDYNWIVLNCDYQRM